MEDNLKLRFDTLVARDTEIDKEYNYIMQNSLHTIISAMKETSEDFSNLFKEIYFGGSFYDNLAVGKLRHEFDLDIIYNVPEKHLRVAECDGNFMPIVLADEQCDKFQNILVGNKISAEKMKNILKTSADRALSSMNNRVRLPNGVNVTVTRRDKLPYTLKLKPTSGKYKASVDIDLVPALKLPTSKLPEKLNHRLDQIMDATCKKPVDDFLAIAMPIVHKEKLEVDFPRQAREILAGKASAKMAIRLLKHERNEKGGPMEKIWSHAIKMAALHEVSKNPDSEHWHERNLPQRHMDIRNALQKYLKQGEMIDIFFPKMNMMDRIKNTNVKNQVAKYLDRSSDKFQKTGRTFKCASEQCNKHFRSENGSIQHFAAKHQTIASECEEKSPKTVPCSLNLCNRQFRDRRGSIQHSVMAHKNEAKEKDIWRNFLSSQGKIPCSFCNCSGGFVRGFNSMAGYNAHAAAMNH